MMSCALVKFDRLAALAVVRVAIVGVSARPITMTTKAPMTTFPVTRPDPLPANLMTKGCIDRHKYKINLNKVDNHKIDANVL